MEKPLLLLALVPLAIRLALMFVVIRSKKLREDTQKDSFACLLDAHGRCRRVNRREPIRMTFHAAARLPSYRPRPIHGSLRHSRNHTTGRFQTHETLKTMTTIIMRTSDDNSPMVVFGFVPRFSIFGKPDYHPRFPRGTHRHPRIISFFCAYQQLTDAHERSMRVFPRPISDGEAARSDRRASVPPVPHSLGKWSRTNPACRPPAMPPGRARMPDPHRI